jgi:general secretion pathway protein K
MSFQHKPIHSLKREQGVVIIMALFIVAIVAAISYIMLMRTSRDVERTMMILRNTEAEFYAQGGLAWAKDVLQTNWEKHQSNLNQQIDELPLTSPINNMNGYQIVTTIYDIQGRFNLNSLDKPEQIDEFRRLLKVVYPAIKDEKTIEIAQSLKNWITPNSASNTTPNEIDRYYLNLPIPYRVAHRFMADVSELRLIKGVDDNLYRALLPYVTALPNTTLLNINSADPRVIMTLSPAITFDIAKTLKAAISRQKIGSKALLANLDIVKNTQLRLENIDVNSSYFLIETRVSIENQLLVIYTVLKRVLKNGRPVFEIISQRKGLM